MGNAQIIAIDFAEVADATSFFPRERAVVVNPVDAFEEAVELGPVVGAALVLSSARAIGLDPLARLVALESAFNGAAVSLAVFSEGRAPRARIFVKPSASPDWVVVGPSHDLLAALLTALLEKGSSVVRVELPENAALRHRLIDIGFNALVKTANGDASIQTELHMLGRKAVVRSTGFVSGRIAFSRRFPLGFAASPVEEARWLAEEIHRETCALVVGKKP